MKQAFVLILVLLLLLQSTSCDSAKTPLDPGGNGPAVSATPASLSETLSAQEGPGRVIGKLPQTVMDVEIEVRGSFRPGEPLQAVASATPNVPARDLSLKIWSPELELAKATGFGGTYRVEGGFKIPSLRRTEHRGALSPNPYRISEEIVIPAPGIYELIVSAVADPLAREFRINREHHKSVWLLVDEKGGRLLQEFDEAEVPEGFRKESGPFRPSVSAAVGSPGTSSPSASSNHGAFEINLYYVDATDSTVVPVRGGDIFVTEWGFTLGDTILEGSYSTDSTGTARIECLETDSRLDLYVSLGGPDVDISTYSRTRLGETCGDPAREWNLNVGPSGAIYMNYEYEIVDSVKTLFSDSRSAIEVKYKPGEDRSGYTSASDYITLNSAAVWGDDGARIQAHEYGHAFHHKALGGNEGTNSCPSKHWYSVITSPQCAFSEGFAHMVATAIGYEFAAEASRWTQGCLVYDYEDGGCTTLANPGVRLLEVEGQVAHFLVDITDSDSTEPFDSVTVSHADLADIYETCQVNKSGWKRPDRIHWMSHCIQKAVDGYSDLYGFPSADEPSSYTVTAGHSPDFDDVRRLWRTQFFNKSTLYDPVSVSITGPDEIAADEDCTWEAVPSYGLGPFSYSWTGVATGSEPYIDAALSSSGWLYLTVTDSLSQQDSDSFFITVDPNGSCDGG